MPTPTSPFQDWLPYYPVGSFEWAPWWHKDRNLPSWIRRDGVVLRPRASGLAGVDVFLSGDRDVPSLQFPESMGTSMRRLDREHPIPRPALRVGQVWAAPSGFEWLITSLDGPAPAEGSVLVFGPGAPWAPTSDPSRWWAPPREGVAPRAPSHEPRPAPGAVQTTPTAAQTAAALLATVSDPEVLYHLALQTAQRKLLGPWVRDPQALGWQRRRPQTGDIQVHLLPQTTMAGAMVWAAHTRASGDLYDRSVTYNTLLEAMLACDATFTFAGYTLVGGPPAEVRGAGPEVDNRDDPTDEESNP